MFKIVYLEREELQGGKYLLNDQMLLSMTTTIGINQIPLSITVAIRLMIIQIIVIHYSDNYNLIIPHTSLLLLLFLTLKLI